MSWCTCMNDLRRSGDEPIYSTSQDNEIFGYLDNQEVSN